jgi:hypothetical protein
VGRQSDGISSPASYTLRPVCGIFSIVEPKSELASLASLVVCKRFGNEAIQLDRLLFGDYSAYFWGVQTLGVFAPMVLMMAVLGLKRYKQFTLPGVALASLLVVAGAIPRCGQDAMTAWELLPYSVILNKVQLFLP